METPITRRATQQRGLEAFVAANAEFDILFAGLQRMSADHVGAKTDAVLWMSIFAEI